MVSVAYGLGQVQVVCILPSVIFKNVFDVYNFFMISNFFERDKNAKSTGKSKVCEQNASYLAKHSKPRSTT